LALIFGLTGPITAFAPLSPDLGAADSFAILAGTPKHYRMCHFLLSLVMLVESATGAGIGLTPAQVTGTIYAVDAAGPGGVAGNNPTLLTTAKNNLITAYDGLLRWIMQHVLPTIVDRGGRSDYEIASWSRCLLC